MRFTVLSVVDQQESETDYETAVDLCHGTIHNRFVQLRAEGGANVLLQLETISRTYTSLEPDLEQFERTGDTVYVAGESSQRRPATTSQSLNGFLLVVPVLPAMSVDDWSAYHVFKHNEGWNLMETMPQAQRDRLSAFHEYPSMLGENVLARPLPSSLCFQLLNALPENAPEGLEFELAVPEEQETLLKEAGQKTLAQKAANSQTHFENQIAENTWKAQQAIAETVKEARASLGRTFRR